MRLCTASQSLVTTATYGYDTLPGLFTAKERDAETGLDYFGARYDSSAQGRFTSPDATMATAFTTDPQTWNRYTYANNNPLKYIDPNGESPVVAVLGQVAKGAVIGAGAAAGASALTQYLFTGKVDWRQVEAASIGGAVAGSVSGGVGGLELAGAIALESGDGAVINALANVIGGRATDAIGNFLGVNQDSGGTAAALDFALGFAGTKIADRFIPAAIEKNWIAARRHLQQGLKSQNLAAQRARAFRVDILGSVFTTTAGETVNRLYNSWTSPSWQSVLNFGFPQTVGCVSAADSLGNTIPPECK